MRSHQLSRRGRGASSGGRGLLCTLALGFLLLASLALWREPAASPSPEPPPPAAALVFAMPEASAAEDDGPATDDRSRVGLAVIGDYGAWTPGTDGVAELVKGWEPDFIITVGDNNYPSGAEETIDDNIGRQYHSFISPYAGRYGEGATTNRFFPVLGNHDWIGSTPTPYLAYFALPGNERYYSIAWGPVELFALSSDLREPNGTSSISTQAEWLRSELAASRSCWKLVYMHHPPFSSGHWGPSPWMEWPYAAWGADAVLAGHDHVYERILHDGIPYFVNGLGGHSIYRFRQPIEGSVVRYNGDFGAMLVEADDGHITFQFITRSGAVMDQYSINKPCGLQSVFAS